MHWGHFRSPDLLTWEQVPSALSPTPDGVHADGRFSGNAISDADRLIASYSACRQDHHQPTTNPSPPPSATTAAAPSTRAAAPIPPGRRGALIFSAWNEHDGPSASPP